MKKVLALFLGLLICIYTFNTVSFAESTLGDGTVELDDGVTIPEGEQYAAHPYKESAIFYTPAEYKFKVSGSDKFYVLLNNVNATEEDGQFVIADYANILNKKYYNSETGSQKFDPTDPLSIAYYINSPDYMNVYIPSEMLDYINEHTWWIERGYKDGTNYEDPYSVSCKIALLSTTEYGKNVDRIGTVVGRHWWLRTPVSNQPNRIAALVSADTYDWQRRVYTHYASTSTWPAIRPCFYLDKEFFKEVKLDVVTMGSEVKKYLRDNLTIEQAREAGYSDFEIRQLGYYGEFNVKLDDGVTIPEGEEYAAHPYKESAVFYTPAEYKFQVSGSNKPYVLLRNVNATEEDGQFVIADYADLFSKVKYYNSDTGTQRFDPTDPLSIAYFINSPDYMNVYIPSEMLNYINEHTWWIERGYKDGTNYEDPYSVRCKVALLSTTEYGENVDRIGTTIPIPGVEPGKGRQWWLRTPVSNQPNRIAALVSADTYDWQRRVYTHYASTSTWPAIRPCFYLDKEFFKEVKLDVATMGSEVKRYLLENVSKEDANRLYTQAEMESIGYEFISFTNVRTVFEDNIYKVMVDVHITGAEVSSEPLVLIGAVYNSDGVLVKTALTNTNIIVNGEAQTVEVDIDVTDLIGYNDYKVKAFAWKDLESLSPYTRILFDKNTNFPNEMAAEAILGQELVQNGFSLVEPGKNNVPYVVMEGGMYCWLMDNLQNEQKAYINFALSSDFLGSAADGSEYVVEFDYYDSGNGYCRLFYDANDLARKEAGTVYLNNERKWKTASFVLQDAAVSKRLGGKYDFQLSIKAMSNRSSISNSSVAIKRFKVIRRVARNPIYLVSWNDEVGNAYKWFEEDKIIHNQFTNLTGRHINATVTHRFINEDYMVPFEKTEELVLAPNETKEVDLNFGELERCDIYQYEVEITTDDNTVKSKFQPYEIAVLKTDPDGILNRNVFFTAHLERYSMDRIREAVKMLKMANVGGIRGDFTWYSLEPKKDQYNWEGHPAKRVVDELTANGLFYLPIMDGSSTLYCSAWNQIPHTPEQLEGWRNFISVAAGILNSYGIERYEIWNEPNITAFNIDNVGGDVYAQLVKIAYEEIKKINPSAKLGAPSVTGLKTGNAKEYFMQAMDEELWNYAEAITLHPYTSTSAEAAEMDAQIQWFKDEYAKVGVEDPEIWNTETGYTTADKSVGTERRKGIWNSRAAIFYKAKDLSDLTIFYNFEKKGTVATDREDQFGHVSGAYDECIKYGKYFVPTISYAMIAGHNYIMADSTAEGIYDSEDKKVRIAKFRSNKFNADIVTLYAVQGSQLVTLNLGTDKITYYDALGNATEIYGRNGVFTFVAGEEPAYIVGHIENVEWVENHSFVSYDKTDCSVAENGTAQINIYNHTGELYRIEVKAPLYAKVVKIDQFNSTTGVGCVSIKNNMPAGEECYVDINIIAPDGKIVQSASIKIMTI